MTIRELIEELNVIDEVESNYSIEEIHYTSKGNTLTYTLFTSTERRVVNITFKDDEE